MLGLQNKDVNFLFFLGNQNKYGWYVLAQSDILPCYTYFVFKPGDCFEAFFFLQKNWKNKK